uniref:Basic leucine zipper nuclear factor 1 n=1 Tax=Paramormyrops kingsleyae TaxID=1676925 RepID=A0A3B3S7J2_9TELE|nr:golgin-45 [Paramormyrops kingsleyae]XP_023691062.1 golgin-45 [Paramormyrops kingsleyae]
MSAVLQIKAPVPVRGSGDGMETDVVPSAPEVTAESQAEVAPLQHSPKTTPVAVLRPGVLHLGKVGREACTEVEATRILVPHAAISRSTRAQAPPPAPGLGEQGPPESCKSAPDWKATLEKLQNSEHRLLRDKEGLSNQLRVQTEVNRELKKLLVASVGDDLQYHFERLAREKNQLVLENEALGRSLAHTAEQLERMSIQCDVWRSKFLASRVMADELTNARATLQRQARQAQSAIQDLLCEREEFSAHMLTTHRALEQLLVSLQWGRQQTYYPSAQPLSTGELAASNKKLAEAVKSHLLGNVGGSGLKTTQASELCSSPAEKMAEKVLRCLDPIQCSDDQCNSSSSTFLSNKKNIGRFHPYTRYENITFNCCERCSGELLVL